MPGVFDELGLPDPNKSVFDEAGLPKPGPAPAAPKVSRTISDWALTLGRGAASGLVTAPGQLVTRLGGSSTVRDAGLRLQETATEAMSPEGKSVDQSPFLSDKPGEVFGPYPVQKALGSIVESAPGMAALGVMGRPVAAGMQAVNVGERVAGALAKVGAPTAIGKAAGTVVETAPYWLGEGLQAGGANAADIGHQIRDPKRTPTETIAQTPAFQASISESLKANPGWSIEQHIAAAREASAQQAERQVFDQTTASTGLIGAATGAGAFGVLERKLAGKTPDGIIRSFAKGAASEALQETAQSGGEQALQNLAVRDYANPDQSLTEGVGEAMALGAVTGGVLGGGMAAATPNRAAPGVESDSTAPPVDAGPNLPAAPAEPGSLTAAAQTAVDTGAATAVQSASLAQAAQVAQTEGGSKSLDAQSLDAEQGGQLDAIIHPVTGETVQTTDPRYGDAALAKGVPKADDSARLGALQTFAATLEARIAASERIGREAAQAGDLDAATKHAGLVEGMTRTLEQTRARMTEIQGGTNERPVQAGNVDPAVPVSDAGVGAGLSDVRLGDLRGSGAAELPAAGSPGDQAGAAADQVGTVPDQGRAGPVGPFTSREEAQSFISQQRRMAPNAPAALPMQHEDGSFGVALSSTPEFAVAQQQVESDSTPTVQSGIPEGTDSSPQRVESDSTAAPPVVPMAADLAPQNAPTAADIIPAVQASPAPVSQAGEAIPQFTQDLNAAQPEQVAGEASAPPASETLAGQLPAAAAPPGTPVVPQPAVAKRTREQVAAERKEIYRQTNPFKSFLATFGVKTAARSDVGGDKRKPVMVPYHGALFRNNGLNLDELARRAVESGFMTQNDLESEFDNGGVNKLSDMIRRQLAGENILPIARTGDAAEAQYAEAAQAYYEAQAEATDALVDEASDEQINALVRMVRTEDAEASNEEIDYLAGIEADVAAEAESSPAVAAPSGDSGSSAPARAEGADQVGFALEAPTAEGLRQAADQQAAAEAQQAQRDAAPPAEDFTLTGSNRAADQAAARGQMELAPPDVSIDFPSIESAEPVATSDTTPESVAEPAAIEQVAPVDAAAAEAATSPKNDRPEPSEAQKDAGNYAKGHANVGGLDVTIENEAGTRRRPEWPPLAGHYGYVKRTMGADGDQVDVFIKPGTPEDYGGFVLVIDQMIGGKFDESKVMIGWPNQPAAAKAYRDSYTKGWKGLGRATRMTMAEFKDWLKNGDTTKPAAGESDSTAKAEAPREKPTAFSRRVAEPHDAAQNDAYETDLFGDPVPAARGKGRKTQSDQPAVSWNVQPASALRDTKAPGGQYLVRTVVGAEVQRKLGAATITTPQEAAQATQYLYRNAVERFDGIVTDKNGKPLAVVGGFKGALGEAAVYPATLVGEAVRIRGAANIWFSHNHPSGTAQLSNADRALNSALANAFRGSGIEPVGLLAVADGRYAFEGVRSGFGLPPGEYGEIGASGSQANVPAIDRVLEPSDAARPGITSTDVARRVASDYYALAKAPGLVLLDSQYRVSAWVPLAPKMLGTLRGTGGLNAIYRAVSESNAGGAIIVHGGELDALEKMPRGVTVAQNIAAALAQVDVQTLDAINARTGVSLAERGAQLQAGPVFSRAEGSDGAIAQVDSHANPAAVGAGRSENRNLGVQPGRTAADAGGKSAGRGVPESKARGPAGQDAAAVLSARGMPAPAVSKIANAIRAAWANGPEVVVVADMRDAKIPQRVRDADAEQRSGGATGDPEGFFVDGKVYLVASALNSDADVARVLAHESLGHYGLRGLFGDRLKPILDQIANVRRAEVAKKAREYGLDPANRDHQLIASEEILAVMAQTNPQLGFVRKAIAAIRQWLRDAGLKLRMTDDDIIAQFILPARAFVERGAANARDAAQALRGEPVAQLSRADAVKKAAADGARAIKGATLQSTWKRLHNAWVDKRPLSIQLLGRRQIVEVYEKLLPELRAYSNEMQQYDADKNESAAAADDIVTKWRRLKDADALAEVMHGATLNEYDPDRSKTPRDLLTPEMREVHDGFQALTPEAQAVYREARDAYETHWNLVKKAIGERIERADISENDRRAMMEQYRDEFLKPIEGVYFPLARFGDYVITVKKDGVTQAVVFAETLTEAEAEQARLAKDFPDADVGKVTKRKEFNAARDSVSKDFVRKLYETVDREAGPDSEALKDAINQLYLTSLPDVSWAKHGIHRKGTPGYNKDARRAFAANMFHGGYHVAKLRHADVLQDYLRSMQERVDGNREEAGYDSVAAQQVVDEMVKRHDATINPDNNSAANTATALGFVWYLGASPASALVNLSQTALVAYPIIGAKFGFGKSQAALLKASSEAVKFRNDFRGKLAGDENEAIERAIREGLVDITQAHDLASISEGRDSQLHGALSPVMRIASKLFHEAEKFNRQATFLAAFRLAKGAGESAESAYDTARDLTYRGHFDYAQSNRPRVMMGPIARVILLFKQYGQNMIYTLGRNAVLAAKGDRQALRTLSGILVAHGLAAGTLGLPLSSILFGLASLIGGSDDEPWDAEVAYRNYLADALGPTLGEIVARGVFRGIFPGDVSARVGLDSLLVRDIDLTLSPGKVHQEILNAILGPVAVIGVNMARGAADMARGDVQRGVEAMLPKAISDGLKTVRYGQEGVKDRTGVDVLPEVKAHELAAQVLGFSPARVKEAYEGRRAALGKEEALKARHNELLADFARALTTNDDEARAETIDKIRRFNELNPAFAITREGIKRSVQNRLRRQVEAQNGVYLPRKHRDLADEGRFANTQ